MSQDDFNRLQAYILTATKRDGAKDWQAVALIAVGLASALSLTASADLQALAAKAGN